LPNSLKHYKDREKAREYRNRQRKANYRKSDVFRLPGFRHWSYRDIELIMMSSMTDFALARLLHRNVRAIQIKRSMCLKRQRQGLPWMRKGVIWRNI
jgi:hypothetical protein